MSGKQAAEILQGIFQRAVNSARAGPITLADLPEKPHGHCVIIGTGETSATVAAAVDAAWSDVAVSGVVVARYGCTVLTGHVRVIEAAHPVSDAMSEVAAMLIVETLCGSAADNLMLALISRRGSAPIALPAPGLALTDKRIITQALLHDGASIKEISSVRHHLSAVKGGKLAAMAQPAHIVSLIISDVPGDSPTDVASGPTVADNSAPHGASRVLQRYGIAIPKPVSEWLNQPAGPAENTATGEVRFIATPVMALATAGLAARQHGLTPLILGDAIEGESRKVAVVIAGMAKPAEQYGYPISGPTVLLSGGETTVAVNRTPPGKGGRNTEFLLNLACAFQGGYGIWAVAGDSDGINGTENVTGTIIFPGALTRGKLSGPNAVQYLDGHGSYYYFYVLNDLLITSPTLTDANDIRAILIARLYRSPVPGRAIFFPFNIVQISGIHPPSISTLKRVVQRQGVDHHSV